MAIESSSKELKDEIYYVDENEIENASLMLINDNQKRIFSLPSIVHLNENNCVEILENNVNNQHKNVIVNMNINQKRKKPIGNYNKDVNKKIKYIEENVVNIGNNCNKFGEEYCPSSWKYSSNLTWISENQSITEQRVKRKYQRKSPIKAKKMQISFLLN